MAVVKCLLKPYMDITKGLRLNEEEFQKRSAVKRNGKIQLERVGTGERFK